MLLSIILIILGIVIGLHTVAVTSFIKSQLAKLMSHLLSK